MRFEEVTKLEGDGETWKGIEFGDCGRQTEERSGGPDVSSKDGISALLVQPTDASTSSEEDPV